MTPEREERLRDAAAGPRVTIPVADQIPWGNMPAPPPPRIIHHGLRKRPVWTLEMSEKVIALHTKTCMYCGHTFPVNHRTRPKRYCSRTCASRHRNRAKRGELAPQ